MDPKMAPDNSSGRGQKNVHLKAICKTQLELKWAKMNFLIYAQANPTIYPDYLGHAQACL
jgi:hypothetical protein